MFDARDNIRFLASRWALAPGLFASVTVRGLTPTGSPYVGRVMFRIFVTAAWLLLFGPTLFADEPSPATEKYQALLKEYDEVRRHSKTIKI